MDDIRSLYIDNVINLEKDTFIHDQWNNWKRTPKEDKQLAEWGFSQNVPEVLASHLFAKTNLTNNDWQKVYDVWLSQKIQNSITKELKMEYQQFEMEQYLKSNCVLFPDKSLGAHFNECPKHLQSRELWQHFILSAAVHIKGKDIIITKKHHYDPHIVQLPICRKQKSSKIQVGTLHLFDWRSLLEKKVKKYKMFMIDFFEEPIAKAHEKDGHQRSVRCWHASMKRKYKSGILHPEEIVIVEKLPFWIWNGGLPNVDALRYSSETNPDFHTMCEKFKIWIQKRKKALRTTLLKWKHAERFLGRFIESLWRGEDMEFNPTKILLEKHFPILMQSNNIFPFWTKQEETEWKPSTSASYLDAACSWDMACFIQSMRLQFASKPDSLEFGILSNLPHWQWHGDLRWQDFYWNLNEFLFGSKSEQDASLSRYEFELMSQSRIFNCRKSSEDFPKSFLSTIFGNYVQEDISLLMNISKTIVETPKSFTKIAHKDEFNFENQRQVLSEEYEKLIPINKRKRTEESNQKDLEFLRKSMNETLFEVDSYVHSKHKDHCKWKTEMNAVFKSLILKYLKKDANIVYLDCNQLKTTRHLADLENNLYVANNAKPNIKIFEKNPRIYFVPKDVEKALSEDWKDISFQAAYFDGMYKKHEDYIELLRGFFNRKFIDKNVIIGYTLTPRGLKGQSSLKRVDAIELSLLKYGKITRIMDEITNVDWTNRGIVTRFVRVELDC